MAIREVFPDWVIDVSMYPQKGWYCYIPYDKETGDLITGMNVITDKSPGNFIGVVHLDGQKALDLWIAHNKELMEDIKMLNNRNQNT